MTTGGRAPDVPRRVGAKEGRAEPRFLALTGPTASGKTSLSLAVARRLEAEIVSVDSRQVYRGLDVGTAKVSLDERARVPHHGLDLLEPGERYSAGRFGRDARRWIRQIRSRGRVPLLVGGTGFFLKVVMEPLFREPPMDGTRREALRSWLGERDPEKLERWVRVLNPDRAEVAAEGGSQRMIRTLEVALLSGRPLTWWHRKGEDEGKPVPGVVVCLTLPRSALDRRIAERTRRMLDRGLVDEVRRLRAAGHGPDDPGMTSTGYREVFAYLEGAMELEEVTERIERSTRQYARRQLTWFRNQLPDDALRLDAMAPREEQVERVVGLWRRRVGKTGGAGNRGLSERPRGDGAR